MVFQKETNLTLTNIAFQKPSRIKPFCFFFPRKKTKKTADPNGNSATRPQECDVNACGSIESEAPSGLSFFVFFCFVVFACLCLMFVCFCCFCLFLSLFDVCLFLLLLLFVFFVVVLVVVFVVVGS